MKPRSVLQWAAGLALAGGGLWIFFHNIDTSRLWGLLVHSSPLLIVCCAGLSVLAIWLRALRSSIILPSCTPAQKKNLFPIAMISFMINNILPARMGEAARAMLLWKRNGYSGAVSVGSLVLERVLDIIVYLSSFFLPVLFVPGLSGAKVPGAVHSIALAFMAAFAFSVGLLAAYSRFPGPVKRIAGRIVATKLVPGRFRTRLNRIGGELISTLEWTFSLRRVACIVVLSYAIVSCYSVMTVLLINEKGFGLLHGLFAQAFAALGAAVPLAPGYVGTLHAVFLQGLLLCGVEREKAVAATIFFHAVAYVAVTILGLYYYFKFGVKFGDISKSKKEINKDENIK